MTKNYRITCKDPVKNIYEVEVEDQILYWHFGMDMENLELVRLYFHKLQANILQVLCDIQEVPSYRMYGFYGYISMNEYGIIFAISSDRYSDDSKISQKFSSAFDKNIENGYEISYTQMTNSTKNIPLFCRNGNKIISFHPDKFPPVVNKPANIQFGTCLIN